MMTYESALEWLYERQPLGIHPGLERIMALTGRLGRPQDAYATVHVAGTNGKGSVATMLANALRADGRRVGLYTSPHVMSFSERIQVDGCPISRDDLANALMDIRETILALDRDGEPPTFFEICTAVALKHFADQAVDWAVIEAGMGGRRDATNILLPRLTVITNVELEHTAWLGTDVGAIAGEKAGILRPGVPLVTAARSTALEALRAECRRLGARMVVVGDGYRRDPANGDLLIGHGRHETRYQLSRPGPHHLENAAVVVAACNVLQEEGVVIADDAIRASLAHTDLPGRLETFSHGEARVIVDAAHNPAAARGLARYLETTGWRGDLIVAFNADKDWTGILAPLGPLAVRVWAVPTRSPRSLDPAEILAAMPAGLHCEVLADFEEALRSALAAGATDLVVAGSIFLAGEARAVLTGSDLVEVGGSQ